MDFSRLTNTMLNFRRIIKGLPDSSPHERCNLEKNIEGSLAPNLVILTCHGTRVLADSRFFTGVLLPGSKNGADF